VTFVDLLATSLSPCGDRVEGVLHLAGEVRGLPSGQILDVGEIEPSIGLLPPEVHQAI
jgi:hypothetical protein